jgi:NADPH2:quinone reductase
MKKMQAIRLFKTGSPSVLSLVEIAIPTPGKGQLLVETKFCGVNMIDTYHRKGVYPIAIDAKEGAGLGGEGCGIGLRALELSKLILFVF